MGDNRQQDRGDPTAFKMLEIAAADAAAPRSLRWYAVHGIGSRIEVCTALSHLRLRPDDTVLDAGSGVGRVTLEMAKCVKAVVAVDISPKSIEQLQRHAEELGLRNISAFPSDLNAMEIEAGTMDRAVAVEVLQHIPSEELRVDAVSRIFRALRPGGRFVTVNYRWHGAITECKEGTHGDGRYRIAFTPSELRDLLARCGFTRISVRGCENLPQRLDPLARIAPTLMTRIDVWASFLPFSARIGKYLLASATKGS